MQKFWSQCQYLVLLLLYQTSVSRPERFQVRGPAEPVVAVAGEDVVLPCYLKPNISAENLEVRWFKEQMTHDVYLYHGGETFTENQIPSYRGRTSLFPEELRRGNTSLKLTPVRVSDGGQYTCFVQSQDWYDDWTVNVVVKGVGTEPVISIEGYSEGGISLLCESEGWYPEPQVVWMDSEGQSLPAAPTETHTDSMGLFTVRRHVIVQERDTNRFSCRVQELRFDQEKERHIDITGEMFHRAHPWKVSFAVFFTLAVLLLAQSAVLIYRCVKLRRKKEMVSTERDHLSTLLELERRRRPAKLEEAQRHAVDVTLDPDSAHPALVLSEDGKQVRHRDIWQQLPDSRKRFDDMFNVLGKEGFSSGRHYWEVQVGQKRQWIIGVATESVTRRRGITMNTSHGYWVICLGAAGYRTNFHRPHLRFPLSEKPQKVGVYVDYEGGQVSFYNVDNKTHIYTFPTSEFTEKIFPLFNPHESFSGGNSAPLIICPVSHSQ